MTQEKSTIGRPNVIYKYLSRDGGMATLENCTVQYTLASTLNDPFEGRPQDIFHDDLMDKIQKAWAASTSEQAWAAYWHDEFGFEPLSPNLVALRTAPPVLIAQNVEAIAKYVLAREREVLPSHTYIACFSEIYDSILMWTHYAENHMGIIVGYRTDAPIFNRLEQVHYEKARPYIPFGAGRQRHPQWPHKLMTTKCADWAYEKEWRSIFGKQPKEGDKLEAHKKFSVAPCYVSKIFLGIRTEAPLHNMCLAFVDQAPRCGLYQARIDEKEYKLVFDLVGGKSDDGLLE